MPRNLDTSLLRVFATVVDQGSMTAAARALHLTQGAVSQQMARLEAFVGGKLLTRERRGLGLTPSGVRLLGKARRMLELNDDIWNDFNGGEVAGVVQLGLPLDLVGTIFAPVLKTYIEAFPNVELSLKCGTSDELKRCVSAGKLDLAVSEELLTGETKGECLAIDRLVWAGAKGGTAYLKTPLPISMVAETCCFKPAVIAALKRQERSARTVFESGSLDATLATVRMDMAVSAWLASTVPADLDILQPETGLPSLPSYAITLLLPSRPMSPAASKLARTIREGLARHTPAARGSS